MTILVVMLRTAWSSETSRDARARLKGLVMHKNSTTNAFELQHEYVVGEREELLRLREESLRTRTEAAKTRLEREFLLRQMREANEQLVLTSMRADELAEK